MQLVQNRAGFNPKNRAVRLFTTVYLRKLKIVTRAFCSKDEVFH